MTSTYDLADVEMSVVSNKLSHNSSVTILLFGLSALALGQALQSGDGTFTFHSIVWLTIAIISAGAGIASQRLFFPIISKKVVWIVLIIGLAFQLFQLLTTPPGNSISVAQFHKVWQFQVGIVIGGVCALLSLLPKAWCPLKARIGLIAAAFLSVLVAGIWVIRASPNPFIDVFMFQQSSSDALLHGQNPYELTPPNIYGNMNYYGAALVNDGKMTIGNPYPPLSIIFSSVGYTVTRDVRYGYLVAILVTGVLMIWLRPGRDALLAAYIFLFTPRIFYVVEQSWTEPLVLLLTISVVWCAIHRPTLMYIALGLLIASKQYMVFLLPFAIFLIKPGTRYRALARSLGWIFTCALIVTLPFAIWNFHAFFWNVVMAQWYQVSRLDALSYAALYARIFGQFPPQFIPFIVLGGTFLLLWRYGERTPAGFAGASAFGLVLFFATSKQAFCNYYFLVIGLLCCALATLPTLDKLFLSE